MTVLIRASLMLAALAPAIAFGETIRVAFIAVPIPSSRLVVLPPLIRGEYSFDILGTVDGASDLVGQYTQAELKSLRISTEFGQHTVKDGQVMYLAGVPGQLFFIPPSYHVHVGDVVEPDPAATGIRIDFGDFHSYSQDFPWVAAPSATLRLVLAEPGSSATSSSLLPPPMETVTDAGLSIWPRAWPSLNLGSGNEPFYYRITEIQIVPEGSAMTTILIAVVLFGGARQRPYFTGDRAD